VTDGYAGTKPINTFVAGLITEAGPLTFPPNASLEESNCYLQRKGNRRRRKGIDFEASYTTSSSDAVADAIIQEKAIGTGEWRAVAGSGNRNFAVVQINKTLFFYDMATQALSTGLKSFTVDLGTFTAPGATEVGTEPVDISYGSGLCFVAGKRIDPFFIEYSSDDDDITSTPIGLLIRDFDGVEDNLEPDEEPVTLTTEHHYNLKNQGWAPPATGENDPIDTYFSSKAEYPGNNKQWWTGKSSTDTFDPNLLARFEAGNTLAPRGRFLLDPFNKDRNTVSGLTGLTVVKEDNRPSHIQFFGGRVWYLGVESENINGHVFFSQVVTKRDRIGKCYQSSDPTTEELNDLLDSDGGVIVIPEMGNVKGTFVTGRFLIIFADNGIWSISGNGTDEAFAADSFAVDNVTSIGCVGGDTIVNAAGVVHWWAEDGIYRLEGDPVSGKLVPKSMTQQTIETFFLEDIPDLSKVFCRGVYDAKSKRIFWHYAASAPSGNTDRWKFDSVLIHDTSFGVFYPWGIAPLASDSPYIVGAFSVPAVVLTETTTNVVTTAGGDLIVDNVGTQVTTTRRTTSARTVTDNTFVKWLCVSPASADNRWTFGEFNNTAFLDWFSKDSTGMTYSSYFITGHDLFENLRNKQSPHVRFFFDRAESTGASTSAGSCLVRFRFDWADDEASGKWSSQEQVYANKFKLDNSIISEVPVGFPVVVRKAKFRGKGRAISIRFDSETGKDFNLFGWEYVIEAGANV